jgi:hypothetical protein
MVGYGLSMDPCWVNILYGSLYPLISIKGVHAGNKPSTYRGSIQEMGVLMAAGYSVIAVWLREEWSG